MSSRDVIARDTEGFRPVTLMEIGDGLTESPIFEVRGQPILLAATSSEAGASISVLSVIRNENGVDEEVPLWMQSAPVTLVTGGIAAQLVLAVSGRYKLTTALPGSAAVTLFPQENQDDDDATNYPNTRPRKVCDGEELRTIEVTDRPVVLQALDISVEEILYVNRVLSPKGYSVEQGEVGTIPIYSASTGARVSLNEESPRVVLDKAGVYVLVPPSGGGGGK